MNTQKIIGRLLLLEQISKEEAILLLNKNINNEKNNEYFSEIDNIEEYENYYDKCDGFTNKDNLNINGQLSTNFDISQDINGQFDTDNMTMDECIEKFGYIPDKVLFKYNLENLVDKTNNKNYKNNTTTTIPKMQHQSYCKSKNALVSKDCICCHYTYSPIDNTFMGISPNKKQKLND